MKNLLKVLPLLSVLVLAGCDTSSSNNHTANPGEDYVSVIDTPVTIDIWTTIGSGNQTAFDTMIDRVKQLEPNITINNTYQNSMGYDGLHTAIVNGFPADNYPDLAYCYPDHVADYINAGKAVDLDKFINDPIVRLSEEDKADYFAKFMAEGQEYSIPGTYSVPFAKSTEALYYSGALLGIDLSSIDSTINEGKPLNEAYFNNLSWSELFDKLCPALIEYNEQLANDGKDETTPLIDLDSNDDAGIVGYDSDDNLFITLAQQYGYEYTGIDETGKGKILFNNDEMKELLMKFHNWANKRYIVSHGTTGSYTSKLFTANQCLFSVSSTAGVTYLWNQNNPRVEVAPIPHAETESETYNAQISQGPSFCVLDHGSAERRKAAWVVYKLLTDTVNNTEWSISTGYMGIRQSFYETDQYKAASRLPSSDETEGALLAKNWQYLPTVSDRVYTSPVFKGSATVRDVAGGLMTTALTRGELTEEKLEEAFVKAENEAKNAL